MKRLIIAMLFFPALQFPAFSQENALDYLEAISREYEEVVKSQWQYARSVAEGADYTREKADLLETLDLAESRIRRIEPYKQEQGLRDSVLLFLSLTRRMVKEDYTRLADLQNLEERSFSELDDFLYAQEHAYIRLSNLAASLKKQEERYAKKYGIRLVSRDDRFARRLLEMNELFSYYNQIYLAFYKAYSQELRVFRTIEEQEPDEIAAQLSLLGQYAREGTAKVKKEGGYKGDRRLYDAAMASLDFYNSEATGELIEIRDYYYMLERLDELGEKRKNGAKNAEEYNTLVREINDASGKLNNIAEALNSRRAAILHRWNEVSANFLAVQLP